MGAGEEPLASRRHGPILGRIAGKTAAAGRLHFACGWGIDAMPLNIRGLMPTARLDKVSLSFGLKPLLDDAALQIRRGERVCLLGRNGEGKSSLLQLITRQIVPDSGEVWVRPGARVASLAQEVSPASDATVRDVVMSGFEPASTARDWQAEHAGGSGDGAAAARSQMPP